MTLFAASMDRDANYRSIFSNEAFKTSKVVSFDGSAGNGAQGTVALFTVTGTIIAYLFANCTEDLAGATATIQVGVSDNTTGFISSTTATNIDNGDIWIDTTPARFKTIGTTKLVGGGDDIFATIATADITDGTLAFYCLWRPMSDDANVVAA